MKIEFSRFKYEMNLTDYAARLGYKIDRKKSTQNSIAMRLGIADKIIISKRNGAWVYFSVYDNKDSGTIVDFIRNRTDKSLFEIGTELQTWLDGHISFTPASSYNFTPQERKPEPARIKRLFTYCSQATNHTYLKGRSITEEILRSPRFEGRVFQDRHKNAVFPHFKNGSVCGLELKGKNTDLFVRGSEKTLWRSNVKKDDNSLIISEAPIDAMSYHILHGLTSAFYIATCGGFSSKQSALLQEIFNKLPQIKDTLIITDHNEGGDRLAHRLKLVIEETDFKGRLSRHSPDLHGQDWNDVLKAQVLCL